MPQPTLPLPDDVRRWIGDQDPAERDALAQTWALAALADDAPPDAHATDAAWARLDALLDVDAGLDAPADARRDADTRADAVQSGLRAWQQRPRPGLGEAPAGAPALLARRSVWAGLATAVAAVLLVVWVRPVTVTADGAVRSVALPDGSEVALAPGSRLTYGRGLRGDARAVQLDGQGYFSVTADGRPFTVETFNARVEVLGTEFDVRAWPGAAAETAVALVEGSVRLRGGGGAVVLAPGQASHVGRGAATPTAPAPVDAAAAVAWRDGAFSVVDAPLGSVAAALEGRFGRPVRLAPGVDAERRLTLFLPAADSAETVLRDLAAYLDLRVEAGADRFELRTR